MIQILTGKSLLNGNASHATGYKAIELNTVPNAEPAFQNTTTIAFGLGVAWVNSISENSG